MNVNLNLNYSYDEWLEKVVHRSKLVLVPVVDEYTGELMDLVVARNSGKAVLCNNAWPAIFDGDTSYVRAMYASYKECRQEGYGFVSIEERKSLFVDNESLDERVKSFARDSRTTPPAGLWAF